MDSREIATQIISHLGGLGKLRAMVSADKFVYGNSDLTFQFKGSRKYTHCRITLNKSADLYKFELFKINLTRPLAADFGQIKNLYEIDGCYNDMLKQLFEGQTGLYLSL